ncbi:MAG TPA: tRNA pseudouridine(38-40) synthase TruA [Flavitalea sp.]|nr:tRNA pseudouridine(38-40) synthase TruA [Flavitalea sp.]
MDRYFLEVRYKGTKYAGFQKQRNAHTVQAAIEEALQVFFRQPVALTGSSRTDSGVHALQNYFHFDSDQVVDNRSVYNLNALLPIDIAVIKLIRVKSEQHCRYDAIARHYAYYIYHKKDPFLYGRAYYYPYRLDDILLREAAAFVQQQTDFTAFAKRNTQVNHFECTIHHSSWERTADTLIYRVRANRFLRGMVRGLTGTMLQVGRKKISLSAFQEIFRSGESAQADFSVPGHGLFLEEVVYPENFF